MNNYIISTDACVNLPKSLTKKYDIPIVPMPFQLNEPVSKKDVSLLGLVSILKETEYKTVDYVSDKTGLTMPEFYKKLSNGAVAKTSQANAHTVIETLKPYLEDGKDVLHISFSSGMSGAYNSACLAAKELQEEFPDRKVIVVDSLSGCAGEGLAVMDAFSQFEQGKTIEEAAQYVEEEKLRYRHFFTVGDMKYIARSGRISSFQELIGTLLGITIILGIDSEGKVYPAAKVRGSKKVIRKVLELIEDNKGDQPLDTILLNHGDDLEGIKEVGAAIKEEYPQVKDFDYDFVNMLVGCNSGPGSLAVFFKGAKRTFVQNK